VLDDPEDSEQMIASFYATRYVEVPTIICSESPDHQHMKTQAVVKAQHLLVRAQAAP